MEKHILDFCYSIGITIVISIVLISLFYSKKRIINEQTKIFTKLLISNLFALILELATMLYLYYVPNYNLLIANFSIKIYMVYSVYFTAYMSIYMASTVYEKADHERYLKIKVAFTVLCAMVCIACLFLPIRINMVYRYGTIVDFLCIYALFNIIQWCFLLNKNIKSYKKSTLIPIILIISFGLVTALYQVINPQIAILTTMEFLLIFISILTMENTDYKMITNITNAKNEVLEAYNNKNEFLKNMSHEIRTPLNGLIGLSDDIRSFKGEIPDELYEEANEIMYNSNLLLETVSNIIDINKLNSQKINTTDKKYSIQKILEQIDKFDSDSINQNVALVTNIDEHIPELYGDADHIRQIFTKIFDNAVSTTTEGTINLTVELLNKDTNPTLRFIVEDTGEGIHEEVLPYIYNYNDEKIKNNKYYNAKVFLNLSIVKKLLEALKGTISISSNYKRGTTVVIEIPQRLAKEVK